MITLRFNDKDDVILNSFSKKRVSSILSLSKYQHGGISGTGRVTYRRGWVNEFEFDSLEDLKNKLYPCLEKDLVREMTDVKL